MIPQLVVFAMMWLVLSLPTSLVVGKAIAYGMGTDDHV